MFLPFISSEIHPKTTVPDVTKFIKAITDVRQCKMFLYRIFFNYKRANLLAVIVLSYIVEVFVHFRTKLQAVKRVMVRGDITVFRGTYKLGNFYFNYCIEANQVNLPPFLRLKLRTPDVHRSVPPNVHLGTVKIISGIQK